MIPLVEFSAELKAVWNTCESTMYWLFIFRMTLLRSETIGKSGSENNVLVSCASFRCNNFFTCNKRKFVAIFRDVLK